MFIKCPLAVYVYTLGSVTVSKRVIVLVMVDGLMVPSNDNQLMRCFTNPRGPILHML